MNSRHTSLPNFRNGLVFGFDVGTGSIGWAVRRGRQFLDVGALICPEETARLDNRRALRGGPDIKHLVSRPVVDGNESYNLSVGLGGTRRGANIFPIPAVALCEAARVRELLTPLENYKSGFGLRPAPPGLLLARTSGAEFQTGPARIAAPALKISCSRC